MNRHANRHLARSASSWVVLASIGVATGAGACSTQDGTPGPGNGGWGHRRNPPCHLEERRRRFGVSGSPRALPVLRGHLRSGHARRFTLLEPLQADGQRLSIPAAHSTVRRLAHAVRGGASAGDRSRFRGQGLERDHLRRGPGSPQPGGRRNVRRDHFTATTSTPASICSRSMCSLLRQLQACATRSTAWRTRRDDRKPA